MLASSFPLILGKVVCALLKEHGIRYIAADLDAPTVTRDRRDGHDVYYGDASDPKFLDICGLASAASISGAAGSTQVAVWWCSLSMISMPSSSASNHSSR